IAMQGEVLGYNTSLRFFGNIIGPMMGGFVSGYFGFSAVFYITSAILLVSALLLLAAKQKHHEVVKNTA
ncbi:MFS transporter, partial [Bacillus dakarensis]